MKTATICVHWMLAALPLNCFWFPPLSLLAEVPDNPAAHSAGIPPDFSDNDWVSLGSHLSTNGPVHALVADGEGNLSVAGDFTAVGDFPANHLARWDGSRWSLLGSGLGGGDLGMSPFPEPWYDPTARALAVLGGELYVGGRFTTADGKISPYGAKARIATPPRLHFSRADGEIRLIWEGGAILQHGTSLGGRPIGW